MIINHVELLLSASPVPSTENPTEVHAKLTASKHAKTLKYSGSVCIY